MKTIQYGYDFGRLGVELVVDEEEDKGEQKGIMASLVVDQNTGQRVKSIVISIDKDAMLDMIRQFMSILV